MRWMIANQFRLRHPATVVWLLLSAPVLFTIARHDPQVAPMAAATLLAPVILPRVPATWRRATFWAAAVCWLLSAGLAIVMRP